MSFNAKDMTRAVRLRPCVSACSARSPISSLLPVYFFLDPRWSGLMGKNSWQTFINGCIYWWCTTLEGIGI